MRCDDLMPDCYRKTKTSRNHFIFVQSGVSLIELVLSIVIISISLTGIYTVINLTSSHSSNPVVQQQALAIAETYLEEILLQAYQNDPVNGYSGSDRSLFDDVDDYNGLNDSGVHDHLGNAVSSLANYNVQVTVSVPQALSGVWVKKITVAVSGVGTGLSLTAYRADYP